MFRGRLKRGKNLILFVTGFTVYQPLREEESVESFTTLGQFNGYSSSNPDLTLENLTAISTKLNESNNSVATAYQHLKDAQKQRMALYADLVDRTQRVKSYFSAQYSDDSKEYKLISRLKI